MEVSEFLKALQFIMNKWAEANPKKNIAPPKIVFKDEDGKIFDPEAMLMDIDKGDLVITL